MINDDFIINEQRLELYDKKKLINKKLNYKMNVLILFETI